MTGGRTRPGTVHRHGCPLCEAMCGLRLTVHEGRVTRVEGDPEDAFSRGYLCPKATALPDIQDDPDRLRRPVRRVGDSWQELGWDEAFDLVGERLRAIRARHGRSALALYQGNPTVHNLGAMLFGPRLARAVGGRNRFAASSVDQLPHHFTAWQLYGHQFLIPVPDLDRTDFLLLLGCNPAASNGSLMSAPDIRTRIQAIRDRGRVVLVDPRRTETSRLASEHLFIRPGTDALLLAAMIHTLFAEDRVRTGRLAAILDGVEDLRAALAGFTPEAVAPRCGIPADRIAQLARDFAAAERAVCHGRMGLSTQRFGGLCQWLVQCLNILTGRLDEPGGAMFTHPAIGVVERLGRGSYGRWKSQVRGLPEFGGELPVACLAEEIQAPSEERIRALITSAGNPVLSTPGGHKLGEALAGLDFMVSIDPVINETTRYADVILPPVGPLSRDHYDVVFHALAIRNTARYSPALFPPQADQREDWQIMASLTEQLSKKTLRARAENLLWRRLGPRGLVAAAIRTGPYGDSFLPGLRRPRRAVPGQRGGLSLGQLLAHPSGVDLGPLDRALPQALKTKDRRIQLAPPLLTGDLPRLHSFLAAEAAPLVLIGRRHLRSNNSWMHNSQRLVKGKERCTLLVHPDDAERLGVAHGGQARVQGRLGAVVAPVEVSDEVMPGVVSLPHGWGHGGQGTRQSVADARPGISVNDVTDPALLDELTGNAALNGVPVEVAPV